MENTFNFVKSGKFFSFKHKYWELQITNAFNTYSYFNIHLSWTKEQDHAGFTFTLEILNFMFDFKVYDERHWDYEKNQFVNYNEN